MAVPVAAIAFYAKRRNRFWAAPALAFGAGLGISVVGISARTPHTPDLAWRLILEPSVWSILLNGLAAAVVFAMALQKGGATAVPDSRPDYQCQLPCARTRRKCR